MRENVKVAIIFRSYPTVCGQIGERGGIAAQGVTTKQRLATGRAHIMVGYSILLARPRSMPTSSRVIEAVVVCFSYRAGVA